MSIESKVQSAVDKIRVQSQERTDQNQTKVSQKESAIAAKKAAILEWLLIAGVNEAAVRWKKQEIVNADLLQFSVFIDTIEISMKSDSGLYEREQEWVWANPENQWLLVGADQVLVKTPQALEAALIRVAAVEIAVQQGLVPVASREAD